MVFQPLVFTITPGSRIKIEGRNGSGKSTLLKILTGIIPPSEGNIVVNGLSLNAILPNEYRKHIGMSLSEEYPFEGSLLENLTFSDDSISKEKIMEVLKAVKLSDFVASLPQGLNTTIYPEGKEISESISKKIVLARAILKQPKILVLENALELFEVQEAQEIIDYLNAESQTWALVVVSKDPYWNDKLNEKYVLTTQK